VSYEGEIHGFTILAVCSLLIETLQCFREGIINSKDGSPNGSYGVFVRFFDNDPVFQSFNIKGATYYKNVRNAILHQGETYSGWKIRRSQQKVFSKDGRHVVIDADRFAKSLRDSVDSYYSELAASKWDDGLSKQCRKKLDGIVANCVSQ
jgi:hypothetical protein